MKVHDRDLRRLKRVVGLLKEHVENNHPVIVGARKLYMKMNNNKENNNSKEKGHNSYYIENNNSIPKDEPCCRDGWDCYYFNNGGCKQGHKKMGK